MSTLKYKATERYAVGWTDSRVMARPTAYLNFGSYRLSDLYNASEIVFDISFLPPDGAPYVGRLGKKEFAAYIEAFLKEKQSGHTNGGL